MSIASNVSVMNAKMKGDVQALMAMAAKGDMAAAVALKEMKDAQDQKAAMMRQADLGGQAPSGTVLSGLAAQLDAARAPMPTTQAPQGYAEGGWKEGDPDAERQTADREAMMDTVRRMKAAGMDMLTLPGRGLAGAAESVITRPLRALGVPVPYLPDSFYGGNRESATPYYDELRKGDAKPESAPTDDRTKRTPGLYDVKKAKPAPAPAAKSGIEAGVGTGAAPKGGKGTNGTAETPEQTPLSDADKQIAALQKLSDEGKALSAKQQELLDAAHKRNTDRLKGRGLWDLVDAIASTRGQPGADKAIGSLVQGNAKYRAGEKQRQTEMDNETTQYGQGQILLQKADLAAARGDLEGAYKLRQEAQALMQKNKLTDAQIEYYKDRGDAATTTANRPRSGIAAGAKGAMTESEINKRAIELMKMDAKAGNPPQPLLHYAQQIRASMAQGGGTMPATAGTAPTGWGQATVK